ncbi:predicted protein [Verticillium alfalfae VaMs.102]|uniref:Predicted protein n=1 Tax=Verticillium alfalfae (strain VaMs.102 / ATCC MYA-4576 / FGSC 10136) TaxID=526221 RepID=C9SCL0_VERA1|nr:predicted protein [Verticillium alfalfae VaMs.102]EEY16825.1 predicted protein [Verticillium alfalfae VaMs.102]
MEDSEPYEESAETAGVGEERLDDIFEVEATKRLGRNSDCAEGIGILMEADSVDTFIELTVELRRLKVNEVVSGCTEGLATAELVAGPEKPDQDPKESLASLDMSRWVVKIVASDKLFCRWSETELGADSEFSPDKFDVREDVELLKEIGSCVDTTSLDWIGSWLAGIRDSLGNIKMLEEAVLINEVIDTTEIAALLDAAPRPRDVVSLDDATTLPEGSMTSVVTAGVWVSSEDERLARAVSTPAMAEDIPDDSGDSVHGDERELLGNGNVEVATSREVGKPNAPDASVDLERRREIADPGNADASRVLGGPTKLDESGRTGWLPLTVIIVVDVVVAATVIDISPDDPESTAKARRDVRNVRPYGGDGSECVLKVVNIVRVIETLAEPGLLLRLGVGSTLEKLVDSVPFATRAVVTEEWMSRERPRVLVTKDKPVYVPDPGPSHGAGAAPGGGALAGGGYGISGYPGLPGMVMVPE